MSRVLHCDICNCSFKTNGNFNDGLVLRQHANSSKHVNHRQAKVVENADVRIDANPFFSVDVADRMLENDNSEEDWIESTKGVYAKDPDEAGLRNRFGLYEAEIEQRRQSLVAATENLKNVSSEFYWNALYSNVESGNEENIDVVFQHLERGGDTDDEDVAVSFDDDLHSQCSIDQNIPADYIDSDDLVDSSSEEVRSFCSIRSNQSDVLSTSFSIDDDDEESEDESSHLLRDECVMNEILRKQRVIITEFYERIPANLNRIGGAEVNLEIALMALHHMINMNFSEPDGDAFLELLNKIITITSGSNFPMPLRFKTLKKAFLSKVDQLFPIAQVGFKLLPCFFPTITGSRNNRVIGIPEVTKHFREIEDALALLLLKIDPDDIIVDFKPEFIEASYSSLKKEHLYNGYGSGDYPIHVHDFVHQNFKERFHGKKPRIFFISVFIDGALMNSTHTRSTIPIVITVLNDRKKSSTVVGFNSGSLPIASETLHNILRNHKIKSKEKRELIVQLALKQLNWDYFYSLFGSFQKRQNALHGFDVQIGLGDNAQIHVL